MSADLFDPRAVRVVTGMVACILCQRPHHHSVLQAGWAFQSCGRPLSSGDHRAGWKAGTRWKPKCAGEWWLLAIPPNAPAGHLAALIGEPAARLLLAHAFPTLLASSDPWGYRLNTTSETTWVQIAVRPRERHLYRQSPLTQIIHHLFPRAS